MLASDCPFMNQCKSMSIVDISGGTGSTRCRTTGSSDGSRSTRQEGVWRQQHRHWTQHAWAWAPPHWSTIKNNSLLSIVNAEALKISFTLRLLKGFSKFILWQCRWEGWRGNRAAASTTTAAAASRQGTEPAERQKIVKAEGTDEGETTLKPRWQLACLNMYGTAALGPYRKPVPQPTNHFPQTNHEFMPGHLPFWSKVKCLGFGHSSLKFYKYEKERKVLLRLYILLCYNSIMIENKLSKKRNILHTYAACST